MQHTITITIPEALESQVRILDNFEAFVSVITIQALQKVEKADRKQQLAEAAKLILSEYAENQDLTSFTPLDGEPCYE
jgi:hypothetical protein